MTAAHPLSERPSLIFWRRRLQKDYKKRADSLVITHLHSPSNGSVPSSPLTQKFCVAMVKQLEAAFCQCCCQVPDVRHGGWGPTAFREALADGPGRCSWAPVLERLGKTVSPCPVHWTSGYWEKITPYCICFFLAKKKKIRLLSQFSVCPVKERYLHPLHSLCYQ